MQSSTDISFCVLHTQGSHKHHACVMSKQHVIPIANSSMRDDMYYAGYSLPALLLQHVLFHGIMLMIELLHKMVTQVRGK